MSSKTTITEVTTPSSSGKSSFQARKKRILQKDRKLINQAAKLQQRSTKKKQVNLANARPARPVLKVRNEYAYQLINPEEASLLAYPDENCKSTAVIKPIINESIPFLSEAYGATPKGSFLSWVFPSYNSPLYMLTETSKLESGIQPIVLTLTESSENGGLYPIGETGAYEENNLFLTPTYRNLDAEWNLTLLSPDARLPMIHGVNTIGEFFGIPGLGCKYTTSQYYGQLGLCFQREVSNTHHIWYRLVDSNGILKEAEITPNNGVFSVNINDIFSTNLNGDVGFPGVGIQLKMVDTGAGGVMRWGLNSVTLRAYVGEVAPATNGVPTITMIPHQFPDVDTINKLVTNHRVIAMSALSTFTGSLVASAGQITTFMSEGGASPGYEGLVSYESISQLARAYTGPAAHGGYTWWSPSDKECMNFRSINSAQDYHAPYIVNAGVFEDATAGNVGIRLRIVFIVEIISKSQLFTYIEARVDLSEIVQASAMVRYLPHSMGNPDHFEKIRAFLRKAGQIALKVGKTIYDNWDIFKPAAMKLAALAL